MTWLRSRDRPGNALDHLVQVLSVTVAQPRGDFLNLFGANVAHAISHFFNTGNFESLAGFNRLDKDGCLNQRFRCAGIQPGEAPAEAFDAQLAPAEAGAV